MIRRHKDSLCLFNLIKCLSISTPYLSRSLFSVNPSPFHNETAYSFYNNKLEVLYTSVWEVVIFDGIQPRSAPCYPEYRYFVYDI